MYFGPTGADQRLPDRPVPAGRAPDPGARPAAHAERPTGSPSGARPKTTSKASTSASRWGCWSASPASPARASRPWPRRSSTRRSGARWATPRAGPAGTARSRARAHRRGACWWTSAPSAARRGPTRSPTPRPSTRSASSWRQRRTPAGAASARATSPSTSPAAAARPAGAKGSRRWRCSSSRTSISPARTATAGGSGRRSWRWPTAGKTITDILDLTVDQALEFFGDEKPVVAALRPLADVGLGYIRLGQPISTLSGGEAQRLKLSRYLRSDDGSGTRTLFIFDEPTTGLHFEDIHTLAGLPPAPGRGRPHRARDRAQHGRGQDRRLGHRPRAGGRRGRRRGRGGRSAGDGRRRRTLPHGPFPQGLSQRPGPPQSGRPSGGPGGRARRRLPRPAGGACRSSCRAPASTTSRTSA